MSDHTLGDAPIDPKYIEQMNGIAAALDEVLNGKVKGAARKNGFVLLVFEYGDTPSRCNFISNGADRRDVVALFKEMIARFEGQPHVTGHA